MEWQEPSNTTSISDLEDRIASFMKNDADTQTDELTNSFICTGTKPFKETKAENATENRPTTSFTDPLLKEVLDKRMGREKAHNFDSWNAEYPQELSDALSLSRDSMTLALQKVDQKLNDADRHFYETGSGHDPVILSSFEASAMFRSTWSVGQRMKEAETLANMYARILKSRNEVINGYSKIMMEYNRKVKDLMWCNTERRWFVYGQVVNGVEQYTNGTATLQAKYDFQIHRIGLLEAQLKLLICMNTGCQEQIRAFNKFAKIMSQDNCYWKKAPKAVTDTKKLDWQQYDKEFKDCQRKVLQARKKKETAEEEIDLAHYQKHLQLVEKLFDVVLEAKGRQFATSLIFEIFGPLLGVVPSETSLPDGLKCSEFIQDLVSSKVKLNILEADFREPTYDVEGHKELYGALLTNTYFPTVAEGCKAPESKWVNVPLSELAANRRINENYADNIQELTNELDRVYRWGEESYNAAEDFRGLYVSHMLTCQKSTNRDTVSVRRLYEWQDKVFEAFPSKLDLGHSWKMLSDKEKVDQVTKNIKALIKQREDAINKYKSLFKKLVAKEKILVEKESIIQKTNLSQDRKIQDQNEELQNQSLKLDRLQRELQNAHGDVEKVKTDWQKKLQRACNQTTVVEKLLKTREDELKMTKLDLEATLTEISETKAHLEKVKKAGREEVKKNAKLQGERDEARSQMLSLKSNEEIVKDRIAKAVFAAEARKDAKIAGLEELISTLNQARLADEERILDVSRGKEVTGEELRAKEMLLQEERKKTVQLEAQLAAHRASSDKLMERWTSWNKN